MNKSIITKALCLLGIAFLFSSCERELSDDAVLATFPKNGLVYIDGFSAGLEYRPFAGSFFAAFSVDEEVVFEGTSSMRFDVPNVGNPDGAFAGAIFPDYGRRNLTEFDALVFYARATRPGMINEIGFGQDFEGNPFLVTLDGGLQLTTSWQQYTIAIPNPAKLLAEAGLFWYSEGPENGEGYSFWIDELEFVKLGNIGQARPKIEGGNDIAVEALTGIPYSITGCSQTLNLGNGTDQTTLCTAAYFDFTSSDESVATVDEFGVVTPVGLGTAVITGTIGGATAEGSVTVNVTGTYAPAPAPTQDPSEVISIFSDTYTNIPTDHYNGFWLGSSTLGGATTIGTDNVLSYTDLNFVGIEFLNNVSTIDASDMTHFRVDVFPREGIDPGDFIRVEVNDIGPDGVFGTTDDSGGSVTIPTADLENGVWTSVDIPIAAMGLVNKGNLAQVIFVSDATIGSIFADNLYFYNDPNASDGPEFPFDFEDDFDPMIPFDFGPVTAVIDNSLGAGNTSSKILQYTKTAGAAWYSGFIFNDGLRITPVLSGANGTSISFKIWSPNAGINVRMTLEGGNIGDIELNQTLNTANAWETMTFDFSALMSAGDSFTKFAIFPDFDAGNQDPVAVEAIYYFDDITQQ
ncbi:MAG: hypothetical protein AAF598_20745 [Bacteroidota bacterium]